MATFLLETSYMDLFLIHGLWHSSFPIIILIIIFVHPLSETSQHSSDWQQANKRFLYLFIYVNSLLILCDSARDFKVTISFHGSSVRHISLEFRFSVSKAVLFSLLGDAVTAHSKSFSDKDTSKYAVNTGGRKKSGNVCKRAACYAVDESLK